MSVELNHTIVHARDNRASAEFLASILGRPAPSSMFGHFEVVELDNGVSLDFMSVDDNDLVPQHYAFLVSEDTFDAGFAKVKARGLTYWADPGQTQANQINTRDGGRGFYFEDPDGHLLELITRPYGSRES
jgi:catechol 2,3-dioxygenase-like lactoylglutathione lyase family enzyme